MHAPAPGHSAASNALKLRRAFVLGIAVLGLLDANRGTASVGIDHGPQQIKPPAGQTLTQPNGTPDTSQIPIQLKRSLDCGFGFGGPRQTEGDTP